MRQRDILSMGQVLSDESHIRARKYRNIIPSRINNMFPSGMWLCPYEEREYGPFGDVDRWFLRE